jgi:hypothetical protein
MELLIGDPAKVRAHLVRNGLPYISSNPRHRTQFTEFFMSAAVGQRILPDQATHLQGTWSSGEDSPASPISISASSSLHKMWVIEKPRVTLTDLLIHVQLERPVRLVVLTHPDLGELKEAIKRRGVASALGDCLIVVGWLGGTSWVVGQPEITLMAGKPGKDR